MFIIRLGFQIVNMKLEIFIKNFSMIYSYIYIQAGQPPATYKGVFIMHDFNFEMNQYLTYCRTQKRLDGKTLKAYRIDLTQFGVSLAAAFPSLSSISELSPAILESYIATLHEQFKPKTVKRKLASLKAFFHYLDYRDRIVSNPFNKLHIKFREPVILPKTIPLSTIESLLTTIYQQYAHASTDFQRRNALRDAAVIELLFATGIRISELCSLSANDINLTDRTILIFGKGSKERITQTEINTLFQLTDGNIGRITALLSEQKGVSWIKDISNNTPTEYEKCLHKIELDIIVGKYQIARKNLSKFEAEYKNDFNSNMHLTYKYNFILSNCEHMLNQYETALDTLSIIEIPMYKKYNKGFKIELQKAHYNKHLWNCNEALEILNNIKDNSFAALVDSLGILAAKYFINDLSVPYSSDNSLEEFKKKFYKASNSSLKRDDQDNYKLKRYEPIFLFYDKKPKKEDILLQSIDEVIKVYEGENNRLRANAYFIKAEIYRLYQQYDKSILEYKRCMDVTIDDNIRIQTNLMIYYLIKVKGIKLNYELMPDDEISRLCQDNVYSCKVRHRIRNIELNDPNATEIQEQIDSRIMPIL